MKVTLKKTLSNISKQNIAFLVFLFVYAAFTLYLGYIVNIWEDEAYSLNTTSLGLRDVLFESYQFEGQPPVYFLILALWRLISPEIFFARLLSIFFIGFAAIYFHKTIRLISGYKSSNWMVIIFLLNPFTVWTALEIRAYSLLIFLSIISIYFFILYIKSDKKNHLYYFLVLCLIGLYTQYFFVFLIISLAFTLLVYRGWQAFFSLCLYLIPVVILFIPNMLFINDNLAMAHSDDQNYSMVQRISLTFYSIQNIIIAINLVPTDKILRYGIRIIFLILFVFSYFNLYNKYKTQNNILFKKYNVILVASLFLFILFTFYLIITGIKFNDRYMAIAFPMFILLFIIFKEYYLYLRNLIFGVISIYFIILLFIRYKDPIKTYDYPSVAQYINNIGYQNEPILLNSRTISVPFGYYYKGSNPLIPLPDSFKLDEAGFQVLITDTLELNQLIEGTIINSKSMLFINDNLIGYSSNLQLTSNMLDKYLNFHYNIKLDTLFFGNSKNLSLRIRRLEKLNNK